MGDTAFGLFEYLAQPQVLLYKITIVVSTPKTSN